MKRKGPSVTESDVTTPYFRERRHSSLTRPPFDATYLATPSYFDN
jgi:hypothetical protein